MIPGLPLVEHFELDALGLDGPSEATVATVDAEFELLLELYAGKEGRREAAGSGSVHRFLLCVCELCMYVHEGGYSTTSGVRLHLPPCLRQGLTGCHAPHVAHKLSCLLLTAGVWDCRAMLLCWF